MFNYRKLLYRGFDEFWKLKFSTLKAYKKNDTNVSFIFLNSNNNNLLGTLY